MLKSGIMAGAYIALGAIIYLAIPNQIVASCFFAVGILLVLNYHNGLITKVVPYYFAKLDYKFKDIFTVILGNTIGASLIGIIISFTRLSVDFQDKLNKIVITKLNDTYLSLFIMALFCGILVAYASLTACKHREQKGIQIFYTCLFITSFVICGFDHVVANIFYFTNYIMNNSFTINLIPILLIVLLGNFIGGVIVAKLEYKKLEKIN